MGGENFSTLNRKYKIHSDFIKFGLITLVLLILTPSVLEILNSAWQFQDGLIRSIARSFWSIDSNAVVIFICVLMGAYLASIPLLIFDEKKRFQGIIFLLVFLYILWYIYSGMLFAEVSWFENIYWVILSFIMFFFAFEGHYILKKKEFKRASKFVSICSFILVVGIFISHIADLLSYNQYTGDGVLFDFGVILLFGIFFVGFIEYEPKQSSISVLGPKNSGKSLFMAGLYLHSLENFKKKPSSPSEGLLDLIEEMQVKGWPARSREVVDYSFIHRDGLFFVKEIKISAFDYPGPYLERISEYLESILSKKPVVSDPDDPDEGSYHKNYIQLAKRIIESKKLILLIDGERYPYFTEMGIKHYLKILRILNEHNKTKEISIVITKCDIFLDEYRDITDTSIIDNENNDVYNNSLDVGEYHEFNKFIVDKFVENTSMKQLLKDSAGANIYTVFYDTVKQEDGGIVLLQNKENQSIYPPYGYQYLMEDLM